MQRTIELLKNAIEAEVRAELFYTKAAELTSDDESRMVFIELSGLEDDHARHLVKWFNRPPISEHTDLQAFLDETEKGADSLLEVDKMPLATGGNMREVLDFAIHQEKKARDNYSALLSSMSDAEDCAFCTELVTEEQAHADRLIQLRNSLDMDSDDRPGL